MNKVLFVLMTLCSLIVLVSCVGEDPFSDESQDVVEILVDGGGANASFNSTASMEYDEYANPYPYNTLEVLANEWNEAHKDSGFKIKIASSSMNNDRETMVPALNQGTAPEIIFYLGTTISEDMNKGWFVDLKDYLDQPNKYSKEGEDGSVKWSDIYDDYQCSFAPNGCNYSVCLELNPIGIVYNKTIFKQLGLEEPETFYDLMKIQDAIYAYAESIGRADNSAADYLCPYMPYYPWYSALLETQIYGEYLEIYDVIDKNGLVNGEEFARAFMTKDANGTRLYSPDDERSIERARLNKVLSKYFPKNYQSYYAEQQFTAGNLIMMESQGGTAMKLIDAVGDDFEIGFFSYPYLTTRPSGMSEPDFDDYDSESAYYCKYNIPYYVRRGLSGYSSGWSVTNSAMNKGDACVEACVDFLQYVTCYTNNDRLINDKGFSIPLSGNTTVEIFNSLAEDYKEDKTNSRAIMWGAINPSSVLNKSYYDAEYLARLAILNSETKEEVLTQLASLKSSFGTAINNLYKQNQWDKTTWAAYTGDLIY